ARAPHRASCRPPPRATSPASAAPPTCGPWTCLRGRGPRRPSTRSPTPTAGPRRRCLRTSRRAARPQ
ncbi:unnamed protein product, partial [Prorocentrum cordatum]